MLTKSPRMQQLGFAKRRSPRNRLMCCTVRQDVIWIPVCVAQQVGMQSQLQGRAAAAAPLRCGSSYCCSVGLLFMGCMVCICTIMFYVAARIPFDVGVKLKTRESF